MLELGGEADLALEAFGAQRTELGPEHLERHRAVVLEVTGEIDRSHAPAPKLTLERVAPAQSLLQASGEIGHKDLWNGDTRDLKGYLQEPGRANCKSDG